MKISHLYNVGLICLMLFLSGCFAKSTPQDVAQSFWESVIHNDAQDVVKYSTLIDPQVYDGFSQDWSGFQASWGKVIIDGDEASIVSKLSRLDSSGTNNRKFVTYLVHQGDEWKVDYVRTGEELRGDAIAKLFGQLDQLGNKISDQFESSSKAFSAEMGRMSEKLEEFSASIGQQTSESIQRYGDDLRRSIDELVESIQRALKERKNNLSDKDRQKLREVAVDLGNESEKLSQPSIQSIADGSISVGKAQQKLQSMDDEGVGEFKQQWLEWQEVFQADMQKMLNDLSTSTDKTSEVM